MLKDVVSLGCLGSAGGQDLRWKEVGVDRGKVIKFLE